MTLTAEKQEQIEILANESLGIIEKVASGAREKYLQLKRDSHSTPLGSINTWTDKSTGRLNSIRTDNLEACRTLTTEPVIARVLVLTEDGDEKFYYISRSSPAPLPDVTATFASYRAPIGRLASVSPGEEIKLNIRGKSVVFEILERVQYHPRLEDTWDSINNVVEDYAYGPVTIESFRRLLETSDVGEGEDLLDSLLNEEDKTDLFYTGIRRTVLDRMSLRISRFSTDIKMKSFVYH